MGASCLWIFPCFCCLKSKWIKGRNGIKAVSVAPRWPKFRGTQTLADSQILWIITADSSHLKRAASLASIKVLWCACWGWLWWSCVRGIGTKASRDWNLEILVGREFSVGSAWKVRGALVSLRAASPGKASVVSKCHHLYLSTLFSLPPLSTSGMRLYPTYTDSNSHYTDYFFVLWLRQKCEKNRINGILPFCEHTWCIIRVWEESTLKWNACKDGLL